MFHALLSRAVAVQLNISETSERRERGINQDTADKHRQHVLAINLQDK